MTNPVSTSARPSHRPLALLAFANALAALGGAVGLATGVLALEGNLNQRLPFASPVFGGIALALIVTVPFTLVAVLAWQGAERAEFAACCAGVLLVGWIVVQLAFLRSLSIFHVFYGAMGALFVWRGCGTLTRLTRPAPRAAAISIAARPSKQRD